MFQETTKKFDKSLTTKVEIEHPLNPDDKIWLAVRSKSSDEYLKVVDDFRKKMEREQRKKRSSGVDLDEQVIAGRKMTAALIAGRYDSADSDTITPVAHGEIMQSLKDYPFISEAVDTAADNDDNFFASAAPVAES